MESNQQNLDTSKYLFFYGHRVTKKITKNCFSNFYPAEFTDGNGVKYYNSEQYLMYKKAKLFNDIETANKILSTKNPFEIKEHGRGVKNFDNTIWDEYKLEIMTEGLILKFKQNPELLEFLLNTGDLILVEASSTDKIWGIGLSENKAMITPEEKWKGQNLLGKALMAARSMIVSLK